MECHRGPLAGSLTASHFWLPAPTYLQTRHRKRATVTSSIARSSSRHTCSMSGPSPYSTRAECANALTRSPMPCLMALTSVSSLLVTYSSVESTLMLQLRLGGCTAMVNGLFLPAVGTFHRRVECLPGRFDCISPIASSPSASWVDCIAGDWCESDLCRPWDAGQKLATDNQKSSKGIFPELPENRHPALLLWGVRTSSSSGMTSPPTGKLVCSTKDR